MNKVIDHAVAAVTPPTVVTRRSWLKGLGLGGATVLVAGTGVLSYRVYDNGVLNAGSGEPYDAWSSWREDDTALGAVGAAILAASPHNTQPWVFRVGPTSIELFADPTRELGVIDPVRREHHIGLGCALENLTLALAARGYQSDVALVPRSADPSLMASVAYADGETLDSSLYDAIGDRHSNRGPYRDEPVSQTVLDELGDLGVDLDGVAVRWFTSADEMTALGALIIKATEEFVADEEQSVQSFAWFRNDRDDIDEHRDGPTLDGQGFGPVTLAMAKILPATSRTAGDDYWLAQTRDVHTATAAAYGVVVVADTDDVATRLNGGRLMQRIHLAATADGLGLQYLNQITERIDRERELGLPETFGPAYDDVISRPDGRPLVTFRVGRPVRAGARSPRRPLSDVIR